MRATRGVGLAVIVCALALPCGAQAFDNVVTTTVDEFADPGPGTGCSLREAIHAANVDDTSFGGCNATNIGPGIGDAIYLSPGATYGRAATGVDDDVANGDYDITGDLSITTGFPGP